MAESNILNFFKEIPESTITALRDIHADGNNSFSNVNNSRFAGICLSPQMAPGSSDETTVSFLIHIVGYNEAANNVVIYSKDELLAQNVGKAPQDQLVYNPALFELPLAGSSNMTFPDRLFYNDSIEFDFAFIDDHILNNFLTSNAYYDNTSNGLAGKGGTLVLSRSIRIERALVQFNRPLISLLRGSTSGVVNYYRTIKVQPWPEPFLIESEIRLGAVGYHVVPTCPPFWRADNSGAERNARMSFTTSSDKDHLASKEQPAQTSKPESSSKKQVIQPPGEKKISPVFQINQEDIRKHLIENGYIPKERTPYKVRLWPYIIGLITIIIGLVGIGVALSRSKIF